MRPSQSLTLGSNDGPTEVDSISRLICGRYAIKVSQAAGQTRSRNF